MLAVSRPTAILDKKKVIANIRRMTEKAKQHGLRFRPHFKTHQSVEVGEWYRAEGVQCITVSSVTMAQYFACHGWKDITIAFPLNIAEMDAVNRLASEITLNVIVENRETAVLLSEKVKSPLRVWIKIDVGYHRAGVAPSDTALLEFIAGTVSSFPGITLAGILAHAGHSYKVKGKEAVLAIHHEQQEIMGRVMDFLLGKGYSSLDVSVGDTPTCSLADDFKGITEIRCGNFVFYDMMQVGIGSCTPGQVGIAVACPVVSKHPERGELLIYGGGVHLSKDYLLNPDGSKYFGAVARLTGEGWGSPLETSWVSSLSQEHGIIRAERELLETVRVGDALAILPVHSCLACDLLKEYRTPEGKIIEMMRFRNEKDQ
jgi:D-serine deaminase-like pyridoxal phosphate-dependent protein